MWFFLMFLFTGTTYQRIIPRNPFSKVKKPAPKARDTYLVRAIQIIDARVIEVIDGHG
jgi:hypothetical protein